jgi:hypothetical protein
MYCIAKRPVELPEITVDGGEHANTLSGAKTLYSITPACGDLAGVARERGEAQ